MATGVITRRKIKKFDTVYVQDFGDDYHKPKNEADSLYMKVRSLTSQYYDVLLYNEHIEIYNEYMDMLYAKYGGKEVFDIYRMEGMIDEFIPNKPRLKKNNVAVDDYRKYGILSSHATDKYNRMQWDRVIENAMKVAYENLRYESESRGIFDDSYMEYEHEIEYNRSDDMNELQAINYRLGQGNAASKTRSRYAKVGYELFEDFYNSNRSSTDSGEFELDKKIKYPSITEALSDNYDPDDYFISESEKEGKKYNYIGVNGRMVSQDQYAEYEFYETMDKLGWDSNKLRRFFDKENSGYDTSIDEMFKKTKKKKSKKDKKKNKKKAVRAAEELLMEIGNASNSENSYSSFEDYESAMLDCTSFGIYDRY